MKYLLFLFILFSQNYIFSQNYRDIPDSFYKSMQLNLYLDSDTNKVEKHFTDFNTKKPYKLSDFKNKYVIQYHYPIELRGEILKKLESYQKIIDKSLFEKDFILIFVCYSKYDKEKSKKKIDKEKITWRKFADDSLFKFHQYFQTYEDANEAILSDYRIYGTISYRYMFVNEKGIVTAGAVKQYLNTDEKLKHQDMLIKIECFTSLPAKIIDPMK